MRESAMFLFFIVFFFFYLGGGEGGRATKFHSHRGSTLDISLKPFRAQVLGFPVPWLVSNTYLKIRARNAATLLRTLFVSHHESSRG